VRTLGIRKRKGLTSDTRQAASRAGLFTRCSVTAHIYELAGLAFLLSDARNTHPHLTDKKTGPIT
jgi:hypothetical protein